MGKKIVSFVLAALTVLMVLNITVLAGESNYGPEQVRVIIENTVAEEDGKRIPWSGILVDEWVNIDDGSTMMSSIVSALGGYSQSGAESGYISDIEGLEEFAAGSGSGWMGTLNDWFTSEGFDAFTVANGKLKDGDEIHIMYTCNGGEDLGSSWNNNDTSVKAISFSEGTLDEEFASGSYEYTLTVPAGVESIYVKPTATNKNFQVRTYSGETEYRRTAPVPVENGTVITVKCGDPTWPSMNQSSGPMVYTFTVKKETAEPKTGDIDGNGKIENKDVVLLFKYISKMKVEVKVKEEALDVNGDGIVNNKDVIRLFNLASEN